MAREQLYTLYINKGTTWRIYHQKTDECGDESEEYDPREAISQYHFYESTGSEKHVGTDTLHLRRCIAKSFPHHHCLMLASLDSTQKLIVRDNIYSRLPHTTHTSARARLALAHIHDKKKKTPFVRMTAYQKFHLTCLSAMTGVVVSRLFGISSAKRHTIRCLKKHADATSRCVHSALASEYLIGNRYYYNLPTMLNDKPHVVGKSADDIKYDDIPDEYVTCEIIQKNRSRLAKLYHSNIDRLEYAIQQFRRGLVSLQSIREDPEFATMFEMFWLVQSRALKQYQNFTKTDISTRQAFCERNGIAFDRMSINIHVCNIVFSSQVVCPRLFRYDIAHVFDNKCQSYIKYMKMVRSKLLQLSNEGLNSAFLAFSAIEPRMVSMKLAPHIEEKTVWNPPCSDLAVYMNHIQSRDEIFGTLLCKHRFHIRPPRPVGIERTFFITKNNNDCFYLSIQDVLEELRTGKKSSAKIWKKNKRNFVPYIKNN